VYHVKVSLSFDLTITDSAVGAAAGAASVAAGLSAGADVVAGAEVGAGVAAGAQADMTKAAINSNVDTCVRFMYFSSWSMWNTYPLRRLLLAFARLDGLYALREGFGFGMTTTSLLRELSIENQYYTAK
jgi:hypothetical protein